MTSQSRADAGHETCHRCNQPFPTNVLKHASLPSAAAVLMVGNSDPDDPPLVEPAALVDRQLYCPSCRRSVNLRRTVVVMAVLIALPAAVWFIARLVL